MITCGASVSRSVSAIAGIYSLHVQLHLVHQAEVRETGENPGSEGKCYCWMGPVNLGRRCMRLTGEVGRASNAD